LSFVVEKEKDSIESGRLEYKESKEANIKTPRKTKIIYSIHGIFSLMK
jgi:hypothetical protein